MARKLWLRGEADVMSVFERLQTTHKNLPTSDKEFPLEQLQSRVARARELLKSVGIGTGISTRSEWTKFYLMVGGYALELLLHREFTFDFPRFAEFLMEKHRFYGAEPLENWREIGVVVRLDSKVARITSILKHGQDPKKTDESLKDSIADIIGYCVIGWHMIHRPYWDEQLGQFVSETC
jgi:hypothetical protein